MSESPEVVQQVQIDQLVQYCRGLFQALGITQLTGTPIEEVVRQCLRANCVQCGQSLTGDDLLKLCLSGSETPNESVPAIHTRLLQGYCSRSGCDSFYYELRLSEHPDLNWASLIEEANRQKLQPASPATPAIRRPERSWIKDRRTKNILYGLLVVVVLLVVRHFIMGGSFPGFRKAQKFQLDPSSIPTPGPR